MKIDTNAPIEGQAAAIVASAEGGPYLARFPENATLAGRAGAIEAAETWRDEHAPVAAVLWFTGRIVHRHIWEPAQ